MDAVGIRTPFSDVAQPAVRGRVVPRARCHLLHNITLDLSLHPEEVCILVAEIEFQPVRLSDLVFLQDVSPIEEEIAAENSAIFWRLEGGLCGMDGAGLDAVVEVSPGGRVVVRDVFQVDSLGKEGESTGLPIVPVLRCVGVIRGCAARPANGQEEAGVGIWLWFTGDPIVVDGVFVQGDPQTWALGDLCQTI